MTTFEITIIMLLAAIVVLLILAFIGMATINAKMKEGFEYLGKKVEYCDSKLGYIKGAAQDIIIQLNNIEDDILDESVGLPAICKKLDDLRIVAPELRGILDDLAINSKGHYNELQQLREEIYSKRLLLGLDTKPSPPCYAPDGICMNPHGDCINCPVRDGATLSTPTRTIKVKGKRCELTDEELMKRINEDNKED